MHHSRLHSIDGINWNAALWITWSNFLKHFIVYLYVCKCTLILVKSKFNIEIMYHCYLIKNNSNGTYIGYTADLQRRLRQHNGEIVGGAKATCQDKSWQFIATVSGFPTQHFAKRFEYYWKHKPAKLTGRYRSTRGMFERQQRAVELLQEAEWLSLNLTHWRRE
jgi:predicted GIY-YIG superfamily endonuclease